ncbi:MAG: iron ABC transporter permease [Thermoplasmata archaeon]|nr:iron ABC transporter permease [Thermoplasmata archaeon]
MAATPTAQPPRSGTVPTTRRRRTITLLVLALVALGLFLVSPFLGTVSIPFETVLRITLEKISGGALFPQPCTGSSGPSSTLCQAYQLIIWDERLPEILLAVLAGAALGMSGGALQGLFRNPLADPFLLGLSSGGTLGASAVFVFGVGQSEAYLALPIFAFLGAIGTGLLILGMASTRYGSVETLLLTGVAIANILGAALALVLLYNPTASIQVSFWLLGGLGQGTWSTDGIVFGVLLIGGTLLAVHGPELNLIQLGNDVAQSAGVDPRQIRIRVLLLTSVLTAVAVAFTGVIGFVGLVAPHVVRRVVGSDYRWVLPGSAIVGALFLLSARDVSLLIFPSSVLPIGIFTAFAGAPFFLYLLYRQRNRTTMGGS